MSFQEQQEGGFVRNVKQDGFRRDQGRKASRNTEPRIFKTHADRVAEAEAAYERWAGMPAITQAREMIAEANLSGEIMAELSAVIAKLTPEKLEEVVNSGKLAEILAELTIGTQSSVCSF